MPAIPYGTSAYSRDRGNLPTAPVVNMFAESVPAIEGTPILQSRNGLENEGTTLGAGPVQALFKVDGDLYAISNGGFYTGATLRGTVNGTGPAKIAAYENRVFANSGALLYTWDGATFSTVTTPDSFSVIDMCVAASRLVVIKQGSGRIYWSDVLSTAINPLSFATAESSIDQLRACLYIGDILVLFGTETVEFWPASASGTTPFQPLPGRAFPVGVRATGCATGFQSTFAWITNKNQIAVTRPEEVISNPDLEVKLVASATASLYTFPIEGCEYLAVRLDTETWVFSSKTKTWSTFQSYEKSNWIPQCYDGGVFGSAIDGRLLQWTADHSDFGGILERRFMAGALFEQPVVPLANVQIQVNTGRTPFLTGTYANPVVEMRTSKDGFIWGDWDPASLGTQGNIRPRVQWRSLGFFHRPGMFLEFRVTDPVPFRVAGVMINEPYGGV